MDLYQIALDSKYVNQIHGFYLDKANKKIRFDIVISFDADDRKKVYSDVIDKIRSKYPEYTLDVTLDVDYNEI